MKNNEYDITFDCDNFCIGNIDTIEIIEGTLDKS